MFQISLLFFSQGEYYVEPFKISAADHCLYMAFYGTAFGSSGVCAADCVLVLFRENSQFYCQLFCIVVYVSAAPSAVLLLYLNRLLSRIHKGEFFSEANIFSLRLISWCSFCVAIVTLLAGLFYLSFLLVAVAFAFIGLIVRVVKNVFEQALAIKEENDLTV